MGRQLNFYMHPDDLAAFQSDVERRHAVVLASRATSPTPLKLPTVLVAEYGVDPLCIFLARDQDLDLVRHVEILGSRDYAIDSLRSPVIEFSRCYFGDRVIRRGRLWFSTGYFGSGGDRRNQPEEFVRWASGWLRSLRRQYVQLKDGNFAGPAAKKWSDAGGQLDGA
jgi:hypothetical protein